MERLNLFLSYQKHHFQREQWRNTWIVFFGLYTKGVWLEVIVTSDRMLVL